MNLDRLIGVAGIAVSAAGIVVSVVVAWLFYILGSRSLHRHKQSIARPIVLRELTHILARGQSLTPAVVNVAIAGALKDLRYPSNTLRPKPVVEDLARDILINPFLTGEQRTHVVRNLESLQSEVNFKEERRESDRVFTAGVAALFTGPIVATVVLTASTPQFPNGHMTLTELPGTTVDIALLSGAVAALIVYWIFKRFRE